MNEWIKGVVYTYVYKYIQIYVYMHTAHKYKLEYYLTVAKERNPAIYNI